MDSRVAIGRRERIALATAGGVEDCRNITAGVVGNRWLSFIGVEMHCRQTHPSIDLCTSLVYSEYFLTVTITWSFKLRSFLDKVSLLTPLKIKPVLSCLSFWLSFSASWNSGSSFAEWKFLKQSPWWHSGSLQYLHPQSVQSGLLVFFDPNLSFLKWQTWWWKSARHAHVFLIWPKRTSTCSTLSDLLAENAASYLLTLLFSWFSKSWE